MRKKCAARSACFLVFIAGCAAPARPSAKPATEATATESGSTKKGNETLPKYFSVEVGPGKMLRASGQEVADLHALASVAKQALDSGQYEGAAVLAQPGVDADLRRDAVGVLADVGFTAIRVAPAPEAVGPSEAEQVVTEAVTAAPADVPAPAVKVETLGLHIGGGTNDADVRERILQKLEESFAALEACYSKANASSATRSFGVDSYVPAAGGGPEVRAVRTSIGGAEFKDCVLGAYTALRFPKQPSGPVVVSYSVRFDPQ